MPIGDATGAPRYSQSHYLSINSMVLWGMEMGWENMSSQSGWLGETEVTKVGGSSEEHKVEHINLV